MTENDRADEEPSAERRTSDRKKLIVDVHFDGGDATGIANTRDIGVGGLYMTTALDLQLGTPIMMSLNAGGRYIRIEGVVVYSDAGHGVGVRFRDISKEDLEYLSKELELG
jgi:hypothetical protein